MSDINVIVNDEIVNIDVIDEPVLVNVVNSPGVPGAPGAPGVGVPVGGTTGQVLAKSSATNYDTAWVNVSGGAWGTITGTLSNQTDLQNALNAKVPYTGATTNVNLGEYEIKAGQLTLDTSPTGTAAVGTTRWNDTIGSSETTLKGGSVILKNGVDLVARVVNKVSPNTTLTKAAYQAVRVSGAQGQRLAVALAQANNDANSADTIGLVTETIATNQEGFIMTVGSLEGINTTGSLQGETWVDGDVLYLSGTTAGRITNVQPSAPIHIVVIGYVEYAHANNGKIYVKVMNGWELNELHNVSITSVANNEALIYESSSALWKNKSIATALGYTPANAATTLTINGVTFDLSANRTFTVGSVTGSGAAGQVAYWTGTSAQSGSNNLFWDNANGRLGIGTNAPSVKLHVNGDIQVNTGATKIADIGNFSLNGGVLRLFGTSAGQLSGSFYFDGSDQSNSAYGAFGIATSGGYFGTTGAVLFASSKNGTGTQLPMSFGGFSGSWSTWMQIKTNGNVLINSTTDGGQRLQVQGTTLLNGNVTFSSATGMFWDATNSRLGIGTNVPDNPLTIELPTGVNNLLKGFVVKKGTGYFFGGNGTSGLNTIVPYFIGVPNVDAAGLGFEGRLFNTSTTNPSLLLSATNNAGTATIGNAQVVIGVSNYLTRLLNIYGNGNLILQNGGTFTDSGERLQVTGDVKITGSGASSATNGLRVLNSSSSVLLNVRNDGEINIGAGGWLTIGNSQRYIYKGLNQTSILSIANDSQIGSTLDFYGTSHATKPRTVSLVSIFNPTSGSIAFSGFEILTTINQTGGANGITRGLYVNPTLTAAADFRAIETARGNVVFGNLPTSSVGLPTGAIWNDAGTIKIV